MCCWYRVSSGGLLSWGELRLFWLYCRWVCGGIIGNGWIVMGWVCVWLEMDWSFVKGVFWGGCWFDLIWFVKMTEEWTKFFTVCSITIWNALKRWSMVLMSALLFMRCCSLISWLYEVSISLRSLLLFSSIFLEVYHDWKMIELYSHHLIEL